MSASEVISVIKAINDHVTLKYSSQILSHFTEKRNAHLLFQRELFDEMDKTVQKLINHITGSLAPKSTNSAELLQKIQRHCNQYNQWKKEIYDEQLVKIEKFEKTNRGLSKGQKIEGKMEVLNYVGLIAKEAVFNSTPT